MATEYVVLFRGIPADEAPEDVGPGREVWVELGRATATTDVAAIKAVAKDKGADLVNGAVAVPVRSWRPRKPERRVQETTLWR